VLDQAQNIRALYRAKTLIYYVKAPPFGFSFHFLIIRLTLSGIVLL
jgi:hypothetical protein